jgi:hypothetical protein
LITIFHIYRINFVDPANRGKGGGTILEHRSRPSSLSHKSMPIRAEKPLEINPIEATIGFDPGQEII